MGYLKFDEAMELKGRKFEDLEVPELGGKLMLASLPAGKALDFRSLQADAEKGKEVEKKQMVLLLRGGMVNDDEKHTPFFADDAAALKFVERVSFDTLQTIIKRITAMMATSAVEAE